MSITQAEKCRQDVCLYTKHSESFAAEPRTYPIPQSQDILPPPGFPLYPFLPPPFPPPAQHPFFKTYSYAAQKYQVTENLGQGAYGCVSAAVDKTTGERVAIKHITHVFDNQVDATRIFREVFILRHLRHDNIIRIKEILVPPNPVDFNDLFVVFERLDTDLHKVIQSNQLLTLPHIQHFMYQMLKGLKYLHSADIFHRDLKPANILLNKNCDLKICDFGMARSSCLAAPPAPGPRAKMRRTLSTHVVTRWYRAPEVILQSSEYTRAIDMWSLGCIFAELIEATDNTSRQPLFPGSSCFPMSPESNEYENPTDQLEAIFEVIGTPTEEDIKKVRSQKTRAWLRSHPYRKGKPFNQVFPYGDPLALDLLQRMLAFDSTKRCTVDDALQHPFLASIRRPQKEIVASEPVICDFDDAPMTTDELRDRFLKEVYVYHPEAYEVERSAAFANRGRKRKSFSGSLPGLPVGFRPPSEIAQLTAPRLVPQQQDISAV